MAFDTFNHVVLPEYDTSTEYAVYIWIASILLVTSLTFVISFYKWRKWYVRLVISLLKRKLNKKRISGKQFAFSVCKQLSFLHQCHDINHLTVRKENMTDHWNHLLEHLNALRYQPEDKVNQDKFNPDALNSDIKRWVALQ